MTKIYKAVSVNTANWPFPQYMAPTEEEILESFKRHNHIRIVHLFNKEDARGGITIAYAPAIYDDLGNPKGKFAAVSVAYCRPNEMYNRKLGEKVALTNMYDDKYILMPIYQDKHPVHELKFMFEGFY